MSGPAPEPYRKEPPEHREGTRRGAKRGAEAERAFHEEVGLGRVYDSKLLRQLWPFVRPHLGSLVVSLLLLPTITYLLIRQPRTFQYAVDRGIVGGEPGAVTHASLVLLVLVVGESAARFGQMFLMQLVGQKTLHALRGRVYAFLQGQRLAFFDRTPIGRLVTRVTNDIDALGELFASGAVTAIGDLITLIAIVVEMVELSPRLSFFAFVVVPPLAFVVDRFRRRSREAFRTIRATTARMNAYLNEQVLGVTVVQAYGQEARCQREFDAVNSAYREANLLSIKYDALLYSVVEGVSSVCVASLLFVAARAAGLGAPAASLGTLVAFVFYVQKFFEPMRDISSKYTILQSSMAAAERIFSLLASPEPDAPTTGTPASEPPVPGAPAVEFRDVRFTYDGRRASGKGVLDGVSLVVPRGARVALVGTTGAGKTTVVSLLQRLYEVDAGEILVDGRDIRAMDVRDLRRRLAVVPQDVVLFAGTILSNVAMGEETPDRARAERCVRDVGLDRLLARRGMGLETPIDERGQNFSAGERQLVAMARALYRDPEILVLDEATSSVDSETEATVQAAIERALHNRTAIVIAHRLSTIREADSILVFNRGQIVERGTHEELLAQGGIYARLHRLQFEN